MICCICWCDIPVQARSYVLEVPDVNFIRPCGVVIALFYCRLYLCCGDRYLSCLQFECFPLYVSVCFLWVR